MVFKLRGTYHYGFIILLTFFVFGNSLKNGYSLDDKYVTKTSKDHINKRVEKGIKGIPEIFKTHYVVNSQQGNGLALNIVISKGLGIIRFTYNNTVYDIL